MLVPTYTDIDEAASSGDTSWVALSTSEYEAFDQIGGIDQNILDQLYVLMQYIDRNPGSAEVSSYERIDGYDHEDCELWVLRIFHDIVLRVYAYRPKQTDDNNGPFLHHVVHAKIGDAQLDQLTHEYQEAHARRCCIPRE